jgi:energy-converting hydrogenase B subunit D
MMTQALQVVIVVLAALGAALVVMVRGRVRQVVALSAYGIALTVLFRTVRAPGVTRSELVVGAVALPLVLLLSMARVRWRR